MAQQDISPEVIERFQAANKAMLEAPPGGERPAKLQWWEMDSEFSRILHAANVLFYCPACDAMAYIGRMPGFNPEPWRKDIFAWRNDPINPPVKL